MKVIVKLKEKIEKNGNNKLIFLNVIGAFLVKGGALIVSLFSMPAYISYFHNQVALGLWFTMLSVLSWVLTFDLGIGNGLRNQLVPVIINDDKEEIKKYVSSAYVVIGIIVLSIITMAAFSFNFINWNRVFNVSENIIGRNSLLISVYIVFSGLMIHFLLKLINSILYAMQKSALNNFLRLINSVIILIYLLLAPKNDLSTSLIRISIVHVMALNVPLLFASIYVFSNELKSCWPRFTYYKREYARKILKVGGLFFWIQIMYMVITTTNEFLITWLTDPSYVVEYQIYHKLFTLIGTIFILALTPIWSAVTKAFSENNIVWINRLYKLLRKLALIAIIFEFVMIIFLQYGINLWLGSNAIQVNYYYAAGFALFGSIFIWNGVLSSIANGLGELKTQSLLYTIGVIVKFPLAVFLVRVSGSWIGVIFANIIAMGLYSVIQPFWLNKILKEKYGG